MFEEEHESQLIIIPFDSTDGKLRDYHILIFDLNFEILIVQNNGCSFKKRVKLLRFQSVLHIISEPELYATSLLEPNGPTAIHKAFVDTTHFRYMHVYRDICCVRQLKAHHGFRVMAKSCLEVSELHEGMGRWAESELLLNESRLSSPDVDVLNRQSESFVNLELLSGQCALFAEQETSCF
jgi:hypothetical protein